MDTHTQEHAGQGMSWRRFAGMIATSTLIMFGLMYQMVYLPDHALFSMNRFMASLAMGCVMTAVMLGFMWPMYAGRTLKIVVLMIGILGGGTFLYLNRQQVVVNDLTFMRSMIPHHSIAINNARKAHLRDPRVRQLADEIIESQVREIEIMQQLIADLEAHPVPMSDVELPPRPARVTAEMRTEAQDRVRDR